MKTMRISVDQAQLFSLFFQKFIQLEAQAEDFPPKISIYPDMSGKVKIKGEKPIMFDSIPDGICKMELYLIQSNG